MANPDALARQPESTGTVRPGDITATVRRDELLCCGDLLSERGKLRIRRGCAAVLVPQTGRPVETPVTWTGAIGQVVPYRTNDGGGGGDHGCRRGGRHVRKGGRWFYDRSNGNHLRGSNNLWAGVRIAPQCEDRESTSDDAPTNLRGTKSHTYMMRSLSKRLHSG